MSRRNYYRIEREKDAQAIAQALSALYPSYRHEAMKPRGHRLFRIALYCRATGAFLKWAEQ